VFNGTDFYIKFASTRGGVHVDINWQPYYTHRGEFGVHLTMQYCVNW